MKNRYDVVIIGGGASGLMAAISCADVNPKYSIAILEKMEKCGRKIRITGKGRCNLTNNKSHKDFMDKVRCEADFFEKSFSQFDNFATADFFEYNGLRIITQQGGRLYPQSGDAWDVVRCFENVCRKAKIDIIVNCEVKSITKNDNFEIDALIDKKRVAIDSQKVIIATGGKSYPRTGSTGDGYKFSEKLGHKVTDLFPSLVPFELKCDSLKQLSGLVVKNINISLVVDNQEVAKEMGEAEFYNFGVGGGTIFRLSRMAVMALREKKKVEFAFDFKPGLNENKLLGRMDRECEENSKLSVEGFARKLFPQKMVGLILNKISVNGNVLLSSLRIEQRKEIISTIKSFKFEVIRDRGFGEAVITAGGVDCSAIESETLKSLHCEGLSFAGEILNIDADTGGYNLQIAFSTGFVAGKFI